MKNNIERGKCTSLLIPLIKIQSHIVILCAVIQALSSLTHVKEFEQHPYGVDKCVLSMSKGLQLMARNATQLFGSPHADRSVRIMVTIPGGMCMFVSMCVRMRVCMFVSMCACMRVCMFV